MRGISILPCAGVSAGAAVPSKPGRRQDGSRLPAGCRKISPPAWVFDGPVAEQGGVHTPQGSYSAVSNTFVARSLLPVYQRQVFRAPVFGDEGADGTKAGTTVFEDDSVRLWHQDDDVLILS